MRKNSSNQEYKVSVRLMTYMHESFIKEAMDGIMMQETNFMVEVVVGDDFSDDRTLDIINSYKNTENIHIKVLNRIKGDVYWLNRQKFGRLYNFIDILNNCNGEYITLLDGDDFWNDPYQLQKQVKFLDTHNQYVIAYHGTKIVDENNKVTKESELEDKDKRDATKDELSCNKVWVKTLTACFRNIIKPYPEEFFEAANGDSFLFSILGSYGQGKWLGDEIQPSSYRVHSNSVWAKKNSQKRTFMHLKTFYSLIAYHLNNNNLEYAKHYYTRTLNILRKFAFENNIVEFEFEYQERNKANLSVPRQNDVFGKLKNIISKTQSKSTNQND